MTQVPGRPPRCRHGAAARRAAAAVTTLTLCLGVTACGDSEGPEEGVTTEGLQDLEDRMNDLDERVGVLEGDEAPPEQLDEVDTDLWTDPEGLLGDDVTVSAEVTELLGINDSHVAFRIADAGSDAITVIATNGPAVLRESDVVEVTGTVTVLEESSFEDDFGVPVDGVLQDADAFFEDAEGQVALRASEVEVLEDGT